MARQSFSRVSPTTTHQKPTSNDAQSQFLSAYHHEHGRADTRFAMASQDEKYKAVPIDLTKAIPLYRAAAAQGHPIAKYRLAYCLYYGKGVPEDKREARRLFKEAIPDLTALAEKGDTYAQTSLGECYEHGLGMHKNENNAVGLYRRAANRGNPEAQHKLGQCYEKGKGGTQDTVKAVEWYRSACAQGNLNATCSLAQFYEDKTGKYPDRSSG